MCSDNHFAIEEHDPELYLFDFDFLLSWFKTICVQITLVCPNRKNLFFKSQSIQLDFPG